MEKIKMRKAKSITIREGSEKFYKWCRVNNYSDYTTNFYKKAIHNFSLFYDLDSPVSDINRDLMEDYALYLADRGISSMSVHTYLRGVMRIVNYLADKDIIKRFTITMPKVETPVKEVYTESELKKLLKKPDVKNCKFSEFRNWVMVNYLLGTGQRRNTVTNIKIKDLDLENALVRLNVTKNKKATILPITKSLVDILEEYLDFRGGSPDDYLFCNESGKKLSNESCTNSIRKYNLRRGVDKTSIHVFRHTFAYMSIKNNIDIVRLQQLLCHSNIKTTQGYLRSFGFEDLRENYEMFNPLENFINKNTVAKNFKERQK